MRGRKPRGVELKSDDIPELEALVRSGKTEQRTARRARVLLGMHRGEQVKQGSKRGEQDPSTIWRVCRRYEKRGIEAVYDAHRSGRPPEISPPQPGAGREPGLHPTGRARVEVDALVGACVANGGDTGVDRADDPLYDHRGYAAHGNVAASSLAVLEDHVVGHSQYSTGSQGLVVL